MYLKGIHNRELNCSGKQNPFHRPNIEGRIEKRNLKQHKYWKCLRVARESQGARSVSFFVPCTGCNLCASWFSFILKLQQTQVTLLAQICTQQSVFLFFLKTKQFAPTVSFLCTNMLRYVFVVDLRGFRERL